MKESKETVAMVFIPGFLLIGSPQLFLVSVPSTHPIGYRAGNSPMLQHSVSLLVFLQPAHTFVGSPFVKLAPNCANLSVPSVSC